MDGYIIILLPSQNVSKTLSTKVNVFDSKFVLDTSTYIDPFLLTLWDREYIILVQAPSMGKTLEIEE